MKNSMNFVKGMAFGLTTAAAITMVATKTQKQKKTVKSSASKAMRAVGDIIENVQSMIKS